MLFLCAVLLNWRRIFNKDGSVHHLTLSACVWVCVCGGGGGGDEGWWCSISFSTVGAVFNICNLKFKEKLVCVCGGGGGGGGGVVSRSVPLVLCLIFVT